MICQHIIVPEKRIAALVNEGWGKICPPQFGFERNHAAHFGFYAGNAFWGLLPLISQGIAPGNSSFFGVLMGAVGGRCYGGIILPRLKAAPLPIKLSVLGRLQPPL